MNGDSIIDRLRSSPYLLWTARAVFIVPVLIIVFLKFFFYEEWINTVISHPGLGQALYHGGPLIVIALIAWFWPKPGAIVGVLHELVNGDITVILMYLEQSSRDTKILLEVYLGLHILFLAGLALNALTKRPKRVPSGKCLSYRETVIIRVTKSYTPVIILLSCIIFFLVYQHIGVILLLIIGLIFAGIAWRWAAPGGVLILILCVRVYWVISSGEAKDYIGHGVVNDWTALAYILCSLVAIGGILNIYRAWITRNVNEDLISPAA